ncbi:MAG: 3,4-dihydroxy-2-butanone-4-phosphate synthase [Rhizobiaceae bacterium]|nr:3,4-dihydroxy-2-butanone-4-phosphate synthase [Rhizobiaceae bacterium]
MVADNDAPHSAAFRISGDFRQHHHRHISADDRTLTVRNLAQQQCRRARLRAPGSYLPAGGARGGVAPYSGTQEAAVDL